MKGHFSGFQEILSEYQEYQQGCLWESQSHLRRFQRVPRGLWSALSVSGGRREVPEVLRGILGVPRGLRKALEDLGSVSAELQGVSGALRGVPEILRAILVSPKKFQEEEEEEEF